MQFILKANVRQNRSENLSYCGIAPDDLVMLSNLSTCLPNMTDRLLEQNESNRETTCITIKRLVCYVLQFFKAVKTIIFRRKSVIFLLFLLQT